MQEFISQLIVRLFSKTPWFFKVIQILSGVVAALLLLPEWYQAYQEGGFILPQHWEDYMQTIIGYALVAQAFLAQLTVPTDVKKKNHLND
jgi:hypothetical protein